MASSACHHALGLIQAQGNSPRTGLQDKVGSFSLELVSKDMQLLSRGSHYPGSRKLCLVRASRSHSSVADLITISSNSNSSDSQKRSNEASLILIRHGESLWNEKNLFPRCVDVPLTQKGVEEAIEAGKRISNIPIDMIYTSSLIRAQMTSMLAMTQHRHKGKQAQKWSQIYSEGTKEQSIPVITAWQLNERMYGELQGLNKQETAARFGKEKGLGMCADRALVSVREQIVPQPLSGENVMIAAHGNSLRSIIMYLDKLNSEEVISLELSTGIPMLSILKKGKFIRRGGPIGPSEAGVYAYTRS
ncbi:2,3-bisphosphoglycerate-dependent phosphoglycerate [Musa troglodytarum]|uniref:Phosphoglycerate mutase n=1 Tax=Musa troglodytarum TaxID=320322 RepID=A0A9E7HWG4_9LILI|nr:2,3-bisphosphoglycerate-dependent phosphoglycerate [Musa troglodytarum]